MKKYVVILLFLLSCILANGQGFDWVFFSENGENFTLIIDGDKINASPQARVIAKNIKGVLKTVRIEFQDTRIPKVTKRVPLRPNLKELTTVIKQNNKGEYILRTLDGSEEAVAGANVAGQNNEYTPAPNSQPIQPNANVPVAVIPAATGAQPPAPAPVSTPVASSGPLTAKFDGQKITLSNGKTYTVKRERDQSGMNGPQVIMKAPEGAAVTITQDGGKEKYTGEVPFVYTVKDYNYYNTYFKLEVTEGNQKWSVKMQNGTSYRFVIEEGSPATIVNEQPVSVSPVPAAVPVQQQGASVPAQQPVQPATAAQTGYGQPSNTGGPPVNWIIYSEMGERFIVFLDGQRINASYEESVTAPNLIPGGSKGIRIEFEDKSIPKILKRYPIVAGGDMTIMLKKKKKGEYVTRVVSAPASSAPIPDMDAPTQAPSSTASSGPVTAKYDGESITLSNGQSYTVKRERDQSGMNPPQVIMKAPEGATVTITQDGGKEVYTGEVPFVYSVQDYNYYNTYFKLEVTEGNKKWSVKMQNGTGYRLVITE